MHARRAFLDAAGRNPAGSRFDHAVSHPIHIQFMNGAGTKYIPKWESNAYEYSTG